MCHMLYCRHIFVYEPQLNKLLGYWQYIMYLDYCEIKRSLKSYHYIKCNIFANILNFSVFIKIFGLFITFIVVIRCK